MDNVDLQVLRQVLAWSAQGHAVVLGTITRTWGSAPRPVGSLVGVRDDGQIAGSVSGGCIEDDLVARIRDGRGREGVDDARSGAGRPYTVRYGVSGDEAARFGLPCGGTIELVLEPVVPHSRVQELQDRLAQGRRVTRSLDMATGVANLNDAIGADRLSFDGATLVSTHGPHWRLILIGAGQMSQYLAEMARALDYQVIVCDPREEYSQGAQAFGVAGVELRTTMPDDTVVALRPDAHTAIIALTHDPKLDDLALMEALASPAFYIGAIGSRTNQARRKQRLAEHFGISAEQLERLHGPVGLKNGARTPPEIAVAILAELTAARYGYMIPEPVRLAGAAASIKAGCLA
jgi:xanthine dehydrogenase accessory factor